MGVGQLAFAERAARREYGRLGGRPASRERVDDLLERLVVEVVFRPPGHLGRDDALTELGLSVTSLACTLPSSWEVGRGDGERIKSEVKQSAGRRRSRVKAPSASMGGYEGVGCSLPVWHG